jgi:multimeric flavodoxin WrbA
MSKKVVILKSSPREKGNSSVLADQVQKGLEAQGATVESIFLHRMDIKACDACDACKSLDGCIIDDDMKGLYDKLIAADVVVLASPIYWFTFNAQLKTFIDRWYGMETQGIRRFAGKKVGIVLAYGDSDFDRSGAINAIHTLESVFNYLQSEIVGIVSGSAMDIGDAEKDKDLMDKAYQLGVKLGSNSGG